MCSKFAHLAVFILALLFLSFGTSRASAQQCPSGFLSSTETASAARTLSGRLVYHDGIRQWFELQLNKPACRTKSIQVIVSKLPYQTLEVLRGCRVRSTGWIGFSPTGYYSRDLNQLVERIEPIGACTKKPPLPDLSNAKPRRNIRSYAVHMDVNYRPGDHPIVFHVRSAGRELRPWQAYADYMLTGSFVLYGTCANGFFVDKVFGTRAARPSHFTGRGESDDMAAYDPEGAAAAGKFDLHLGYTCIREP